MMATNKIVREQEPGAIASLLPWHATGRLTPQDRSRVEEALSRDPDLARQFALVQEECAATIQLNEGLGAPSPHALEKLFAAIDAEPARRRSEPLSWFGGRVAALSPRVLALAATATLALLLVQGGVIAALVLNSGEGRSAFQVAEQSLSRTSVSPAANATPHPAPQAVAAPSAPAPASSKTADNQMPRLAEAPTARESAVVTRSLATPAPRALVRFAPQAPMSAVVALLDRYQATVLEGARGGLFRLQVGDRPLSRQDFDGLLARLQAEEIVTLAVAAP